MQMINRNGDKRIVRELEEAIARREAGDPRFVRIFARGKMFFDFNTGRVAVDGAGH